MIEGWNERRKEAVRSIRTLNPRHHPQGMVIVKNIDNLYRKFQQERVEYRRHPNKWEMILNEINVQYTAMLSDLDNEFIITALMD